LDLPEAPKQTETEPPQKNKKKKEVIRRTIIRKEGG
jgi:hypothetical protein